MNLKNIIQYIIKKYSPNEISVIEIIKLLYIINKEYERKFNKILLDYNFEKIPIIGIYSKDLEKDLYHINNVNIKEIKTNFGNRKRILTLEKDINIYENDFLNQIINKTKFLSYNELIRYIDDINQFKYKPKQ